MAWAERLALFLVASLLVYLDYRFAKTTPAGQALQWTVFAVLAACILLNWRLQAARPFRITPLDLLIVFLALVVPNLPAAGFGEEGLSAAIAKLMTLFYGVETLATAEPQRHRLLTAGAMIGAGAVLARLAMLRVIPLS
jgi:UDP-GlcNAc:undecaprenyl-phosphate GlcNAc-1-phosphate transferase